MRIIRIARVNDHIIYRLINTKYDIMSEFIGFNGEEYRPQNKHNHNIFRHNNNHYLNTTKAINAD